MKTFLSVLFTLFLSLSLSAQYEYSHEENYTIAQDGLLTLDTEDANVTIIGTSRSDAYVKIYKKVTGKQKTNQKFDIEYIAEGGNLTIREKRNKKGGSYTMGWNTKTTYEVELGLPKGVSMNINGEDDNYMITSINGDITIKSEDGDIVMSDCTPDDLSIRLEDGDVKLTEVQSNFVMHMEDGDLVTENCKFGDLKIGMEDGDVILRDVSLGNTEIDAEDGDISITTECNKNTNVNIETEDGNVTIKTKGEGATIKVSYEDGDVRYDNSDYDLINKTKRSKELKTSKSGDATFNISVEDGNVRLSNK